MIHELVPYIQQIIPLYILSGKGQGLWIEENNNNTYISRRTLIAEITAVNILGLDACAGTSVYRACAWRQFISCDLYMDSSIEITTELVRSCFQFLLTH
jgi:hypothetical protein